MALARNSDFKFGLFWMKDVSAGEGQARPVQDDILVSIWEANETGDCKHLESVCNSRLAWLEV